MSNIKLDAQIEFLEQLDAEITSIIDKNNGARTKEDILAVFNATLLHLHDLRSNLYESKELAKKTAIQREVFNILGSVRA